MFDFILVKSVGMRIDVLLLFGCINVCICIDVWLYKICDVWCMLVLD